MSTDCLVFPARPVLIRYICLKNSCSDHALPKFRLRIKSFGLCRERGLYHDGIVINKLFSVSCSNRLIDIALWCVMQVRPFCVPGYFWVSLRGVLAGF